VSRSPRTIKHKAGVDFVMALGGLLVGYLTVCRGVVTFRAHGLEERH